MANRFCPNENDYFPSEEFAVIDGTLIHHVKPPHRATDGIPVNIVEGRIEPPSTLAVAMEAADEE